MMIMSKGVIDFYAQGVADLEENLRGSSSSSAQSLESSAAPVNQHPDNPLGVFSGQGVVAVAGGANAQPAGVYEKKSKSFVDMASSFLKPCWVYPCKVFEKVLIL